MYAGIRPSNYWFIEARGLALSPTGQLLLILMLRTRTTSLGGAVATSTRCRTTTIGSYGL